MWVDEVDGVVVCGWVKLWAWWCVGGWNCGYGGVWVYEVVGTVACGWMKLLVWWCVVVVVEWIL